MARLIRLGDQKLVPPDRLDLRIVASAQKQHGVIGRTELTALGATDEMIRHRVATRRLFRIHRGVYSIVPPSMLTRSGRYMAAALACGEEAVISHRSAAALIGLRNTPMGATDVTVPRGGSPAHVGLRIHSSRCLDPTDRAEVNGVPCTSWARTLIDCAATGTKPEITRMVEKALILRIYDHPAMEGALERSNGKTGTATLRRILADLTDDQPYTASEFHRDLLFLIADHDLPAPIENGWVCGYQVDLHWPDAKLVVEADDRATHATPIAFERDHERDLTLELAGWHVLRLSARQLRREPRKVVAAIAAKLGARPHTTPAAATPATRRRTRRRGPSPAPR